MAHVEDRRWSTDPATGERRRTDYTGPAPWRARYRTPEGKARAKGFRRKVDAERFLLGVESSKLTGEFVAPEGGRTLFGDRYDTWFATTVNLRASTRARDESYARSLVLPTFGRRPLSSIDHDSVQQWVSKLTAKGYAPATVVKAHQILGKVMRSAVKARLIAASPCDDTELPRIEREEQRFLTPSEVFVLADAIDPAYRTMVLTAAYSGLRFGELAGLRAKHVDLLRAKIGVFEICTEVRGTHVFGPPKTRAGRRRVPVPRLVVDELIEHLAGLDAESLVFTSADGSPLRANNWRRRVWQPACVAVGMGEIVPSTTTKNGKTYEGLRPHDLRHTAISLWIAADASPKEIAARAGHASVATVLDRYGHLLPGSEDRVNDALDAMAEAARSENAGGSVVPLNRAKRSG
jgi:integrase